MANFRYFNAKLTSLRNMQRVTKTMKMVSATKLRKAQEAQRLADQFYTSLQQMALRIAGSRSLTAHPLLTAHAEIRNVLVLLITADKGLCGGFNSSLIRQTEQWILEKKGRVENLRMSCCGRQGHAYFKDKMEIRSFYEESVEKPDFSKALTVGRDVLSVFLDDKYDEVYLAYNVYHSPLSQAPVVERILPFTFDRAKKAAARIHYLFEPDEQQLLEIVFGKMVCNRIFFALLQNATGEHGARMTAMDSATSNIDKLSDMYVLMRNRARQASITNELVEIVSGSEALG
ncbi:MAG: ATP synthase F1 subunit gamma [Lentisphaerota bacterium]